ncbi:unnamed protein product [Lepeophtheirus salmonis]|uniref:(salmon louse) hypothetical protein n=1 Tax=Lepeophtheirus salmonis TaxID=72036 RepID=A0A7R8HAR9_LEPSM|nr:unnamed protein product [Lepeophtheirus salmonis]CAF2975168.1 unnamed protein product [Lepeophtheirus salmonis]
MRKSVVKEDVPMVKTNVELARVNGIDHGYSGIQTNVEEARDDHEDYHYGRRQRMSQIWLRTTPRDTIVQIIFNHLINPVIKKSHSNGVSEGIHNSKGEKMGLKHNSFIESLTWWNKYSYHGVYFHTEQQVSFFWSTPELLNRWGIQNVIYGSETSLRAS